MEQSPEESDRDSVSPEPKAVSRLVTRLEDLARGQESVPIEDLVATIGAQGQAPLLMTVAIFMISPIGMVPGVGGALGLVVAALGIQMIAGRGELWLPRFIRHRTLSARRIRGTARRIRPAANWLRRHLRIRMERLASGKASLRLIAAILVLSGGSLLVIGGIPIAAPILGLPIAVFALGLLSRDGAVVAAGYLLVLAAIATLALIALGG